MNVNPSEPLLSRVRVSKATMVYTYLEWSLWSILGFSLVIGLFGYSFFTLHPENLVRFAGVAHLYAPAMTIGAQLQSVGFVALMAVFVWRAWGARLALWLLVLLSVIGFLAEWVGTTTHFPFGHYSYTHMLGYKIFGEVPWVIPPSWFAMGVPCYVIAHALTGSGLRIGQPLAGAQRLVRIFVGAWLLMSWDLVLDPAMSALLPYWEWHEPGFYYNSPLINFFGWFGVGALIMAVLDRVTSGRDLRSLSVPWCANFYALNWAMSGGMCLLAGEWFALVVGLAAVVPFVAYHFAMSRTKAKSAAFCTAVSSQSMEEMRS